VPTVAEVLPDNSRMLTVFRDAGYEARTWLEDGYYALEFAIAPTQDSLAVMETREHRADARSVAELLAPSSIVVLGAGHRASSAGRVVLRHLDAAGFTGAVYVVNPRAAAAGETVAGHVPYALAVDIGAPLALAVVAVPAGDVKVKLDGTTVTATSVTKNGAVTSIAYNGYPTLLASGTTHTISVAAKDTNNNDVTGSPTFVVPTYATIPAGDAVTGVDTTKVGFKILPWQSGIEPNAVYWANEQLVGLHGANNACQLVGRRSDI
jgi:hypothetical protein